MSKLFDTLMVFLKNLLNKLILIKNLQMTKKHANLPSMYGVIVLNLDLRRVNNFSARSILCLYLHYVIER